MFFIGGFDGDLHIYHFFIVRFNINIVLWLYVVSWLEDRLLKASGYEFKTNNKVRCTAIYVEVLFTIFCHLYYIF